ncbi:helix-turn-helix transcriptional regulator [Pendulispora rubella]|uniref:Helix-turn-helix transcriptional regulator n=1 Tax=Pendulispora rubella TaxID=2741070 RepID=A0ABZ2L8X6_9BACT
MIWSPHSRIRPLFEGGDLLVGEWHCWGVEKRWFKEVPVYAELDLPRDGMHLRAVGRKQHVIHPATAAFSAAHADYTRASPTSNPATSTLIFVRGELAEALPRNTMSSHPISSEVATLHVRLLRATDPVAVEEAALAILQRVLVTSSEPAPRTARDVPPSWRRLADELQHVIATRYGERLTLERLATLCKTSPFHASRVFRTVTGETIHGYLTRVRLRVALFELRRGAGRLTDIALATGFSSHSHFTSAFRTEFGYAPSTLAR